MVQDAVDTVKHPITTITGRAESRSAWLWICGRFPEQCVNRRHIL